jgi:hypothetical protein
MGYSQSIIYINFIIHTLSASIDIGKNYRDNVYNFPFLRWKRVTVNLVVASLSKKMSVLYYRLKQVK